MMSDEEIGELADDIKKNRLRQAIVLWRADADSPDRIYILDGRNRLAALERLGVTFTRTRLDAMFPDGQTRDVFTWSDTSDPAAYVISANLRRRHLHLTKEQQAELIARAIMAGGNDMATLARSFNPTPGKRGGSSKDPVREAAIQEGQKFDISPRTTDRALKKLRGNGPPRKKRTTVSPTAERHEASAVETSEPPTTAAAVSKRIGAVMRPLELAIQQADKRWPHGHSRQPLILFLHSEADRLARCDEA
jgi:hypothetical protein